MKQENLNVINSEAMGDKISEEMMGELTGSGSGSGSGSGCGSASGSGSGSGEKEPELDYRPLTGGTENMRPAGFPEYLDVKISWGSGKFAYNTTPPSVSAEYSGDVANLVSDQTNISASWAEAYVVKLTGVATAKESMGVGHVIKVYNLNTTYSIPGEYKKEEKEPEE